MVACRQLRRDAVDFTGVDHLLISMKIAVPAAAGWRHRPRSPCRRRSRSGPDAAPGSRSSDRRIFAGPHHRAYQRAVGIARRQRRPLVIVHGGRGPDDEIAGWQDRFGWLRSIIRSVRSVSPGCPHTAGCHCRENPIGILTRHRRSSKRK